MKMKLTVRFFCFLLLDALLLFTSCNYPEEENVTIHSVEGKCSIVFPGRPTKTISIKKTSYGNQSICRYSYKKSEIESYLLSFTEYPAEAIKKVGKEKFINSLKKVIAKGLYGKVKKEEQIVNGRQMGIKFNVRSSPYHAKCQIFFVDNTMYQLTIMKINSYPKQAAVKAFMNSFELDE